MSSPAIVIKLQTLKNNNKYGSEGDGMYLNYI